MNGKLGILAAAILMVCIISPASAQSAGEQLEKGVFLEETKGDLDGAIKVYEKIVADAQGRREVIAKTLFRLSQAYVKKNQPGKAIATLKQLVANYADMKPLAVKGRRLLDELVLPTPAALMPANTFLYAEIGSPGEQIATIVEMLKGTPLENPLRVLGGGRRPPRRGPGTRPSGRTGKTPAGIVSALLNPDMLKEFKKIRGAAVGIQSADFGRGPPAAVAVLYPGDSDALKGIMRAALESMGQPGEAIEGMKTVTLSGGLGACAYDSDVFIATTPASRLPWCVKQYKGVTKLPSLADSNASFKTLTNSRDRRRDALTVWADGARLYTSLLEHTARRNARELRMIDAFVDFRGIEGAVGRLVIDKANPFIDVSVKFRKGHRSLAYDLVRTPNLTTGGFQAVPADVMGLASIALGEAADGAAAAEAAKIVNRITGLDIGRELFANIEQVTLFVVAPTPEMVKAGNDEEELFMQCVALTITSRNPAKTAAILDRLLGAAGAAIAEDPEKLKAKPEVIGGIRKYSLGQMPGRRRYVFNPETGRRERKQLPPKPMDVFVGQSGKSTVLAMKRELVVAALAAAKAGQGAAKAGALQPALAKLPTDVSKLAVVNIGQVARAFSAIRSPGFPKDSAMLAVLADYAKLFGKTTVQLYTREQPNRLGVRLQIKNLPPLSEAFRLYGELMKAQQEDRRKRRATGASAAMIATTTPPVGARPRPPSTKVNWTHRRTIRGAAPVVFDLDSGRILPFQAVPGAVVPAGIDVVWSNSDGTFTRGTGTNSKVRMLAPREADTYERALAAAKTQIAALRASGDDRLLFRPHKGVRYLVVLTDSGAVAIVEIVRDWQMSAVISWRLWPSVEAFLAPPKAARTAATDLVNVRDGMIIDLDFARIRFGRGGNWPGGHDIGWSDDSGGTVMVDPDSGAKILALPKAKTLAQAKSMVDLAALRKSNVRTVVASKSRYLAVLTDCGNVAIASIVRPGADQLQLDGVEQMAPDQVQIHWDLWPAGANRSAAPLSQLAKTTINDLDNGAGNEAIVLATGKQVSLPAKFGAMSEEDRLAWLQKRDIDLLADYANNEWSLLTVGGRLEHLTGKAKVRTLTKPGMRQYVMGHLRGRPMSFRFTTRRGVSGVIRVIDTGARAGQELLLRYRTFGDGLAILLTDEGDRTVTAMTLDGEVAWSRQVTERIYSVAGLPNGHVLLGYATGPNEVEERDLNWRVVSSIPRPRLVNYKICEVARLPNGNTLISNMHANLVREVTPAGKTVWEYKGARYPFSAERLANGNTLMAEWSGRRVTEVNRAGEVVWQYDCPGNVADATQLPNGNVLIAQYGGNRVIEVNKKTKQIVWARACKERPVSVRMLPDGNIVICNMAEGAIIVNRAGAIVRTLINLQGLHCRLRLAPAAVLNLKPKTAASGAVKPGRTRTIQLVIEGKTMTLGGKPVKLEGLLARLQALPDREHATIVITPSAGTPFKTVEGVLAKIRDVKPGFAAFQIKATVGK